MRVMPEEVILDLLGRSLQLSQDLLPHLAARGSTAVPEPLVNRCREILDVLQKQKRNESVLSDESWEWIWEVRPGINHLQLYGRLAWLNYNLFDLL